MSGRAQAGQSDEELIIIRNHSRAQSQLHSSHHHPFHSIMVRPRALEESDSQHDDALTQKYKFQCPESLSLEPKVINYQSSSNKLDNFKGLKR